jgi:hypothetical protein
LTEVLKVSEDPGEFTITKVLEGCPVVVMRFTMLGSAGEPCSKAVIKVAAVKGGIR